MAKKTNNDERRAGLSSLLSARYIPTSDPGSCDDMLSTEELHDLIERHAPGLIPLRQMRVFLLELGFTEKLIGSSYLWLLQGVR